MKRRGKSSKASRTVGVRRAGGDVVNVDVSAFLAFLKQHEPNLAMNYVSRPHPHLRDDLTDGPDAVTIDGWWFVADLEAAIRAAIHNEFEENE